MRLARLLRGLASTTAVVLGLWHSKHAEQSWRLWRDSRQNDPSAADFYWTDFQIETAFAIVCFVAGVVMWKVFSSRVSLATRPNEQS